MRGAFFWPGMALQLAVLFGATCARADFTLSPSSFSNIQALLDSNASAAVIKTIGFATDHRAYEGATGLGTSAGIDLSLQVTMVKLPQDFRDALSQAGMSNLPLPVIPVPRVVAHKGLGDRFDVGFSWVGVQEISVVGADAKFVVYQPEEGPTWAVRLNYTWASLDYEDNGAAIIVKTQTFKPEVLLSQKLDFAEPYLGIGYELTRGNLEVRADIPPVPAFDSTVSAHGGAGIAFIGLGLRIPNIALRLLIDGEYSTVGAHALGAKFGFNF